MLNLYFFIFLATLDFVLAVLFCDRPLIVLAESSAVDLCYCFLALKRTVIGFGHFVFTLGRINTYSAFYQEFPGV